MKLPKVVVRLVSGWRLSVRVERERALPEPHVMSNEQIDDLPDPEED